MTSNTPKREREDAQGRILTACAAMGINLKTQHGTHAENAWQLAAQALDARALPIGEEELIKILTSVDNECRGFTYEQRNQWQARAILNKLGIQKA